jgi:hypothetical protein
MRKPLDKNRFLDSKRQGEQERKKLGFARLGWLVGWL